MKKRKPMTSVPEDFVVTKNMLAWALARGFNEIEVSTETEKFIDRNISKGEIYADWNAAWRNWMRNALEFRNSRRGPQYTQYTKPAQPKRLN